MTYRKMKMLCVLIAVITAARTFVFAESKAERVISLSPAITEIIYALGAEENLVGVTSFCNYPEAAQEKEKVGGFLNPNLEKIISLKPDRVILSRNGGALPVSKKLESFGITLNIVKFYSIEDILEAFSVIGEALGKPQKAQDLAAALQGKVQEYRVKTGALQKRKVVFIRWHEPLLAAAQGSLENDIIEAAGGINIIKETANRYPAINLEYILAENPDVIIDARFYVPTKEEKEIVRNLWRKWTDISAVKNSEVYVFKNDEHARPGPRTEKLIDAAASIIHPEIFSENRDSVERLQL